MTDKELRKLNRYQLLELLVVQKERADKLQLRLEAVESQISLQYLQAFSLGSIAEASLQLNGVFEAAQKAADAYIDAAKKKAAEIEADAKEKADAMIAQAYEYADALKIK